jgi:hypothetical protein
MCIYDWIHRHEALCLEQTSRFAANQPSWLLEASSWKLPHE